MHLKEKLIQMWLERLTNITPDFNKNEVFFFMIGPWKTCFHTHPPSMYFTSSVVLLNYNNFINNDIQYVTMKIIIFSMVLMY